MRCSSPARFRQQVRFLQRQFLLDSDSPFTYVLPADTISQALTAAGFVWKDRIYTPLVRLWIFLGQVLSADHHVGHRPGRIEPRLRKRRFKKYDYMMKPRYQTKLGILKRLTN